MSHGAQPCRAGISPRRSLFPAAEATPASMRRITTLGVPGPVISLNAGWEAHRRLSDVGIAPAGWFWKLGGA
jgi:hypothetical protein